MSKIGRKPIPLTSATVGIEGKKITLKGPKGEVAHEIADGLSVQQQDKKLLVTSTDPSRRAKESWGLHRALLANKVAGVEQGFQHRVKIVGLGFKAQLSGSKLVFSLGFSHKVEYTLPKGVSVEVDKKGQDLLFSSTDRFLLGNVCDAVRSLKPPEPYKGTGIIREREVIIRKAGKTKSA